MARLKGHDFRSLLKCIEKIYTIEEAGSFIGAALKALKRAISCDFISCDIFNSDWKLIKAVYEPADVHGAIRHGKEIFSRLAQEHPLLIQFRRKPESRIHLLSDVVAQGRFQRQSLYNELYRRVGIESQIALALPSYQSRTVAFVLNRGRQNFSERDRLMLTLIQPHLLRAYRNAIRMSHLQNQRGQFQRALEAEGRQAILLTPHGELRTATAAAIEWLFFYFRSAAEEAHRFPLELRAWIDSQRLRPPDQERKPLTVRRGGKYLIIRFTAAEGGPLLLLNEEVKSDRSAPFRALQDDLDLTPREAEALYWLAKGKTNKDIGAIMGISARTVQKHLEHVYLTLGVETRTAAAAVAHQIGLKKEPIDDADVALNLPQIGHRG